MFPLFVGGSVGTVAIKPHNNAYVSRDWGMYSYTRIDYHPDGIGSRSTYYLFLIDEIQDTVFLIQSIDNYEVKSNILFPVMVDNVMFSIRNSGTYSYISEITDEGVINSIGTYPNGTITSFDAIDKNHLYLIFHSTDMDLSPYIFMTQINGDVQSKDTFYTKIPIEIDIPAVNIGYMSVKDQESGNCQILKSDNQLSQWESIFDAGNCSITDINFYNNQIGFAVLYPGTIIKTLNGGVHWDTVYCNVNQRIIQLNVLNSNYIYACGSNGLIINSFNGGTDWELTNTDTTEILTKLFVFDNHNGYTTSMLKCYKMAAPFFTDFSDDNNWTFGPNPNYGVINFHSEKGVRKVEIVSMEGKLMYSQDTEKKDLIINYFPNQTGVYLLNITHDDGKTSSKKIFFIQKK